MISAALGVAVYFIAVFIMSELILKGTLPENIFAAEDADLTVEPGQVIPADKVTNLSVNPIDIYVERVAAKVRVQGAEGVDLTKMPVYDAEGKTQMKDAAGNVVYAKILGWDVTNTVTGANMLQCNLDGISPSDASNIFRWFPIGAAVITPFLGSFLDHKGKGATMLMWGALLLIACHLIFAFVLPATHSYLIAYSTIVLLGISFALVPAALWPSVPKIIDEKVLGSAYCLIFWVQNFGLCFVPMLIGSVLASSNADNPAVIAAKEAGSEFIPYNYTLPLVIFACFGVAALILAAYLKFIDKKHGYGLEEPNIKA